MPTNLALLAPSRKRLRAGDIFVMRPLDRGYVFGRIVSTDAVWSIAADAPRANLVYIYAGLHQETSPQPSLTPDALLVPPLMTNRLGWSRGYFQNVAHEPLRAEDVLPVHCFRFGPTGAYYDDQGRPLPTAIEPVGQFGLHSFRTIDDEVSQALGLPLSEE